MADLWTHPDSRLVAWAILGGLVASVALAGPELRARWATALRGR